MHPLRAGRLACRRLGVDGQGAWAFVSPIIAAIVNLAIARAGAGRSAAPRAGLARMGPVPLPP